MEYPTSFPGLSALRDYAPIAIGEWYIVCVLQCDKMCERIKVCDDGDKQLDDDS